MPVSAPAGIASLSGQDGLPYHRIRPTTGSMRSKNKKHTCDGHEYSRLQFRNKKKELPVHAAKIGKPQYRLHNPTGRTQQYQPVLRAERVHPSHPLHRDPPSQQALTRRRLHLRHHVRLRPLRPVRTFLQAQSGTKPPKCLKADATATSRISQNILVYFALQETRLESWIPVNPLRIFLNAQNAAYLNT